jgi:uncharacterized protein
MATAEDGAGAALRVEIAWSPAPREMRTATLRLPEGATLADALKSLGWPAFEAAQHGDGAFGEAGLSASVWGRSRPLTHVLRDGDRLEVLRALATAPMDARRARYRDAGGVKALRDRAVKAQKG